MGSTLGLAGRNRRLAIFKRIKKEQQQTTGVASKKVTFSLPKYSEMNITDEEPLWKAKRAKEEKATGLALKSRSFISTEALREAREKQVLSALRESETWQSTSKSEQKSMEHLVVMRLANRRYGQHKLSFEVMKQREIDPIDDFEAKTLTMVRKDNRTICADMTLHQLVQFRSEAGEIE